MVCPCCAGAVEWTGKCDSCRYAVGFHYCLHDAQPKMRWRKGSLFDGSLDVQRAIFNLHRKLLPTEVLRDKVQAFINAGHILEQDGARLMTVIEAERSLERITNPEAQEAGGAGAASSITNRLNAQQLAALLKEREANMKKNRQGEHGVPDQWRVYQEIIAALAAGPRRPLRMMVQASAGTGKSYVLTSVYLWAILQGINVVAAAPTGIAAANIEVEGTEIAAMTLHNVFDLRNDMKTGLDLSALTHPKVKKLHAMQLLLLDEVSMIDVDLCQGIQEVCSMVDHNKRPQADEDADCWGQIHVVFFGDFKQSGAL